MKMWSVVTSVLLSVTLLPLQANNVERVQTIEEYKKQLPYWGVSWAAGNESINGYYPTFYTGFAPRSQSPERIHVRVSRGNQARVTVILDENTIWDYLFDLVKRSDFYAEVSQKGSLVRLNPDKGFKSLPQMQYFQDLVSSNVYGIRQTVDQVNSGAMGKAELYQKGLSVIEALNPGRVFRLKINLASEFAKWAEELKVWGLQPGLVQESFSRNSKLTMFAINSLLLGRINYTEKPSAEVMNLLIQTAELALQGQEEAFVQSAVALFKTLTGSKYQFQVLDEKGQWASPIQCASAQSCFLAYTEFTAIFPVGSVMQQTRDEFGNSIADFATPGLWQFLDRKGHDVDNIRDEPYYGWAPKMDYEGEGNGFHNPAVRFGGLSKEVKAMLGIQPDHKSLWSVKRGGVSSGCLRLPLGHTWELRHIFPVQNDKMNKIYMFGNDPRDFDIFDINGDGAPEVMGVEYFISYNLKGASGLAKREGTDLSISQDRKFDFYRDLYGEKNVFRVDEKGQVWFQNPGYSLQSYVDFQDKEIAVRTKYQGELPLFEAKYEQDKVQFYAPYTMNGLDTYGQKPLSKRIVRLMGRVRGCAPFADKVDCGEAGFDQEAKKILAEIGQ